MISVAAVQGKTNPVQLVLISLLEVSGFILNKWVLQSLLKVNGLFYLLTFDLKELKSF